jgi:hypothetical protein
MASSETTDTITGGCNCGKYVYTIPKPTGMNLCHCIDCRKWAGAMSVSITYCCSLRILTVSSRHSAHLFVETKDITADVPKPRTHTMTADSGNTIERAWCDDCGCGLWIRPSTKPDMTFLKAGLFNPGEIPNPTMENWLRNLEPWEV